MLHCRTKTWLIVVGHRLGASLHWMIHLLHRYRLLHKQFHKQPRAGAILRPSLDVYHRHRNSLAAGNTARRRHNQSQSIRADRAIRPCDVTAFCLVVWLFFQILHACITACNCLRPRDTSLICIPPHCPAHVRQSLHRRDEGSNATRSRSLNLFSTLEAKF